MTTTTDDNGRRRRTLEHGYTISSLCEPEGLGELKIGKVGKPETHIYFFAISFRGNV